jgi:protein-tyrosine phosphatase
MESDNYRSWSDLPLCHCGLRHWPEELRDRHVVSHITAGLGTADLWLSGDAPDDPTQARSHTEHVAAHGVRRIVDVRAAGPTLSRWDADVLLDHGIDYQVFGLVDHHDAFTDEHEVRSWVGELLELPPEPTLIHCHVGVNRSASAVVALLVGWGVPVRDAVHAVLNRRPTAMAVYAPAMLHAFFGPEAGHEANEEILRLRADDRRLEEPW